MIQLHLIKNPYNSLDKGDVINLDLLAVEEMELQLNINSPHQFTMMINPKLGYIYQELLDNPFAGIRIDQDDGLSLGFIKKNKGQKAVLSPDGRAKINFQSTVSLLNNEKVYPRQIAIGQIFKGTTEQFFKQISDKVIVDFISSSEQENYYPNIGSAYDILAEGSDKLGNYSWRDLGIRNEEGIDKVCVEVGNANARSVDNSLLATNLLEWQSNKPNVVLIEDIPRSFSGETLTHVRPFGNRGSGGDISSTLFITRENKSDITQKDGFALVPSELRLANGTEIYEIENTSVNTDTKNSVVYPVNLAEFQDGNEVDVFSQVQQVYNQAVNYLKNKSEKSNNLSEIKPNKIIMAGTKMPVRFANTQMNGEAYQVNEVISVGQITYNTEDFIRFLNN